MIHWKADKIADMWFVEATFAYGQTEMARLRIATSTGNKAPTITHIEKAAKGPIGAASWTVLMHNATNGDNIAGPLYVSAANNNDGTTEPMFTGGAHLYRGSPTAILDDFRPVVDGLPIDLMSSPSGTARELCLCWTDRLMGYNTASLARFIAKRHHMARITPGSIEQTVETRLLEDGAFEMDYGPQIQLHGFGKKLHFWGGDARGAYPLPAEPAQDTFVSLDRKSGPSEKWPTDRIAIAEGASGFLGIWVDPKYGAGDLSMAGAEASALLYFRAPNKVYGNIVSAPFSGPAGTSYRWRGGVVVAPLSMASGPESAFRRTVGGKVQYLAMFPTKGRGRVVPLESDVGKFAIIDGKDGVMDPRGVAFAASHYGLKMAELL